MSRVGFGGKVASAREVDLSDSSRDRTKCQGMLVHLPIKSYLGCVKEFRCRVEGGTALFENVACSCMILSLKYNYDLRKYSYQEQGYSKNVPIVWLSAGALVFCEVYACHCAIRLELLLLVKYIPGGFFKCLHVMICYSKKLK